MSSRFALRLVADRLQEVCHVSKNALWWQNGVANGIARTLVMTPTCGMNPLIASRAFIAFGVDRPGFHAHILYKAGNVASDEFP